MSTIITTELSDEALPIECPHCGRTDLARPAITRSHTGVVTRTTLAATTEHLCTPAQIKTTRETR